MRLWGPRGCLRWCYANAGPLVPQTLPEYPNPKTVLFTGDAQTLLLEASSGGIPRRARQPLALGKSVSLSVKRIVIIGLLETFHPDPLQGPSLSPDFPLLPEKYGLC